MDFAKFNDLKSDQNVVNLYFAAKILSVITDVIDSLSQKNKHLLG